MRTMAVAREERCDHANGEQGLPWCAVPWGSNGPVIPVLGLNGVSGQHVAVDDVAGEELVGIGLSADSGVDHELEFPLVPVANAEDVTLFLSLGDLLEIHKVGDFVGKDRHEVEQ